MNQPVELYIRAAALFWGLFLGVFYFGGLWLTVRKLPVSRNPKTLWIASFMLRLIVLLSGLWLVLRQDMIAFGIAFISVMVARVVISKTVGRQKESWVESQKQS